MTAEIEVVVLEIDKENRRLSLGHKQLEENPWDVFETIFTRDSVHEGTILEVHEKGAMVALPYGVEGFVQKKHLMKEDGIMGKQDDKLDFKVVDFNKAAKKIVLSHTRVYEDKKRREEDTKRRVTDTDKQRVTRKIKTNLEKTTLGDITDLAALKTEMEESQKKNTKKETPKSQ